MASSEVKKALALKMLATGDNVYVNLDSRKKGVIVPDGFAKAHLCLSIGLNMVIPITDLDITDEGISCALSFNRRYVWCMMPWHAIFGLKDSKEEKLWHEDVPRELFKRESEQKPEKKFTAVKSNRPTYLRLIRGGLS